MIIHVNEKSINKAELLAEHEVLLCCARTSTDAHTTQRLKTLLQTEIDWDYTIDTATNHGVMPLLYQSLSQTCVEAVPASTLTKLQAKFYANVGQNLALTSELLKILELLAAHNIPAIPFKGPVLAVCAYGSLALRQFTDLDLLIHKQDALKIKQLLLAQGYQRVSSPTLTATQELMYLQAACEYRFISNDGRVALEPHWGFTKTKLGSSLNPEPLWHRLQSTMLVGTLVPNFAPEDTLLIICLNGTKDRWASLNRICDVAELIGRHPQLNWQATIERAQVIGCQRMLLLGLLLAGELFAIELPDIVRQQMAIDRAIAQLAVRVCHKLFAPAEGLSHRRGTNFSLWDLQVRERWQDKGWYCFNLVFAPNEGDAEFVDLPASLYWLYPLLRPCRLAIRFVAAIFKKNRPQFRLGTRAN